MKKTDCPQCGEEFLADAPGWVECPDCECVYWVDENGTFQRADLTCPECLHEWEDYLVEFPDCPECNEVFEVDEEGQAIINDDGVSASPYDDFDGGESRNDTESKVLKLIEDFGVTSDYQNLELSEDEVVEEDVQVESFSLDEEKYFKKANSDLYRLNPYRLLGLDIQASDSEIRKETEKLKLEQKLHKKSKKFGKVLPVTPPPDPDSFQEAIQELNDPEFRLFHGLFWFSSNAGPELVEDQGFECLRNGDVAAAISTWENDVELESNASSIHHLAIMNHLLAIENQIGLLVGPSKGEQAYWNSAIFFWKLLLAKDDFWNNLSERIRKHNDPRIAPELSFQFKEYIPFFLSCQLTQLALNDVNDAAFYLEFVENNFSEHHLNSALRVALEPHLINTKMFCESAIHKAEKNPENANKTFDELINKVNNTVYMINQVVERDSTIKNIVHDRIVAAGNRCASIYANETKDWSGTLVLLKKLLTYANRDEERNKIQEAILVVSYNAQMHLLDELMSIGTDINEQLHNTRSTFIEVQKCSEKITNEMLPLLKRISQEQGEDSKLYKDATIIYCGTVQNLSIAINNYHKDYELALKWLKHARSLVKDPELVASIDEGIAVVGNNARQAGNDEYYRGDFPTGPGLSWVVENNIMERHGGKIVLGIAGSIFLLILLSLFNYESNRPGYKRNPTRNQYTSTPQTTKAKRPTSAPKLNVIQDKIEIKKAQMALNMLGYNCGYPDGIWGLRSEAALKDYSALSLGMLNTSLQKQILDRAEDSYTIILKRTSSEIDDIDSKTKTLEMEIDSYRRRSSFLSNSEIDIANTKVGKYNALSKRRKILVNKHNKLIKEVRFIYDIKG